MQPVSDLVAILIGVVCGIAAGIPTSALLLVALAQRDARRARQQQPPPAERPPLCWIIEPGGERVLEIGPGNSRPALN